MKHRKNLKEIAVITVGAAIIAAAVKFFMLPSHISIGSVAAIAMVLENFLPVPVSVMTLIMNVVLLLVGFLLIGPEFGAKTAYTSIVMPLIIGLYDLLFPDFQSITQEPILDMVCCIWLLGIGLAILFSRNASSGGLDIVAKLVSKYLKVELGMAISAVGVLAAMTSSLVYDSKTLILSLLGTYFEGLFVDYFIFGMNIKRKVCVISPQIESIVEFVLTELGSGATLNHVLGAYERTPRLEMIAVVDKQEYKRLMDYIQKVDPKAFVTVDSVRELMYQPKIRQIHLEK